MRIDVKHYRVLIVGLALLLSAGCGGGSDGPGLVDVEGTVTMDGKPLANATVFFSPAGEGVGGTSPSFGKTDEDGEYFLQYSISKDGAIVGKYKVSISTHAEADEDDGTKAQRETVPAKYNVNTELEVEVTKGGGPYDFSLKSDGKVIQPGSGDE